MNNVCLTGIVGRLPECHTFDGGDRVLRLALGVHYEDPDRNGKEPVKVPVEWFRIHFYGKAGEPYIDEILGRVKKGDMLAIKGVLRARVYELPNGTKNNIVYIEVRSRDEIDILTFDVNGVPVLPEKEEPVRIRLNEEKKNNSIPDKGQALDQYIFEVGEE